MEFRDIITKGNHSVEIEKALIIRCFQDVKYALNLYLLKDC